MSREVFSHAHQKWSFYYLDLAFHFAVYMCKLSCPYYDIHKIVEGIYGCVFGDASAAPQKNLLYELEEQPHTDWHTMTTFST